MRVRRQRCEEPCFAPSVIWSTISHSIWPKSRTKHLLCRKHWPQPEMTAKLLIENIWSGSHTLAAGSAPFDFL
jgi:hypothetical protein